LNGARYITLPDPPPLFGKWNNVFKQHRDWVKGSIFKRLFDATSADLDME
jgi:hypothetical protein